MPTARAVPVPGSIVRLVLLAAWVALVSTLSWHHVFWRDEVRAMSFAIQGRSLAEMFQVVKGDGHPLVWFLILRGGHVLIGPAILPVAAHIIGFLSVALLLWRAPFRLPTLALLAFSHMMAFEYAVMARNYGISMLLMFAFAAGYREWRGRGLWLAMPMALLANTNAHSAALAWLLLGAWMLDLWPGWNDWRGWLLRKAVPGGLILIAATLACYWTVLPSINDLATFTAPVTAPRIARAILLPGAEFLLIDPWTFGAALIATLLLVGATFILWGRPALMLAAIGGLVALSILFAFVYPASNRHRMLWLAFLVALAWIRKDTGSTAPMERLAATLRRIGNYAFHALLLLQLAMTGAELSNALARPPVPNSRAHDLGRLLATTPGLRDAVVIADPDYMTEALAYYAPANPVWRIRQGGWSAVNIYTAHGAKVHLTLDEITRTAAALHGCTGRPVVILMESPPWQGQTFTQSSGYAWTTRITPDMTRRFYSAVKPITVFGPSGLGESYTVFRYDPHAGLAEPSPASPACAAMRYPATSAKAGWRQP